MTDGEACAEARTRAVAQGMRAAADEGRSEIPLICFTLFAPAAVGVSVFALALAWAARAGLVPTGVQTALAAAAFALVSAGMLASVAHLARPLRAPRSLANWRRSWLSREILAVSAFWVLVLLWLGASTAGGGAVAAAVLNGCAALAGALLLAVIARAYCVHGQPAWNGPDTLIELVGGALGAGAAVAAAVAACGGAGASAMLLAWCAVGAAGGAVLSAVVLKVAWAHRIRRVADLAVREDAPRVRAACEKVAEFGGFPRAYRALAAAAVLCAFVALAVALFGGDATMAASAPPAATAVARVALAIGALCELAALASIRNRFYALAAHGRYAVRLRR